MNWVLLHVQTTEWFPLLLPPLHPILVNFTAAMIPSSFVCDLLGRLLHRESLRSAAWWMMMLAVVITPFTAAFGWWWLWQDEHPMDPTMRVHAWLGTALATLLLPLAWWRGRTHNHGETPRALYLLLLGAVTLALAVQGHLGGSMSFVGPDREAASDHAAPPADQHTSHR